MTQPISPIVLRALSHPIRLAMLVVLEQGEMTAPQLAERIGTSEEEMRPHLEALKSAGLILDGEEPDGLRAETVGWAAIDRQLHLLAAEASAASGAEGQQPSDA
jgi:DNA-binding transcriptional ArsR family regulator